MTTKFGSTMKNKPIRATLVLALAFGVPVNPTPAAAQSPRAEAPAITHIYVDADAQALGARGKGMQEAVIRETGATFEAAGVELVAKPQPDAVQLRIRFTGTAEDVRLFKYVLHFELIEGKTATQLIEPVTCEQCFDPVLYDKLNALVPALLEAIEGELGAKPDPEVVESDTGDDTSGDTSDDGDTGSEPAEVKRLGPMGGVGIGVLALGAGAVIWGAVEWSKGQVHDQKFGVSYPYLTWTDHTPRGQALLGAGIGGVVVGGALLTADLVLRSKRRKNSTKAVGAAVPLLSPTGLGLVWTQRF